MQLRVQFVVPVPLDQNCKVKIEFPVEMPIDAELKSYQGYTDIYDGVGSTFTLFDTTTRTIEIKGCSQNLDLSNIGKLNFINIKNPVSSNLLLLENG